MKEPKLYPRTYTIKMDLAPGGGLVVTVPEIGVSVTIASTRREDALDAAHREIERSVMQEYEAAQEKQAV